LHARRSRTLNEEKRYDQLSVRLTVDSQQFQAFLNHLYQSFGKAAAANERMARVKEATRSLQKLLADLGEGAVGLSTVVLDQKLDIIVVTSAVAVPRSVPISKLVLRTKVFDLNRALVVSPPTSGDAREAYVRAKAADVYKVLIAPIERDLRDARATT